MRIQIDYLLRGAAQARGFVVVIDVFRSMSSACCAFAAGAEEILAIPTLDAALHLKLVEPDIALIGQMDGKRLTGFDYGDSPAELVDAHLGGRRAALLSNEGLRALCEARLAEEVVGCCFLNLEATALHVLRRNPALVTLVAVGEDGATQAPEDDLCAAALRDRLLGRSVNWSSTMKRIQDAWEDRRPLIPARLWPRPEDITIILEPNRHDFAMGFEPERLTLRKLDRSASQTEAGSTPGDKL